MLIVADSSALVALATFHALPFLTQLYVDVKVPQSVYDEVTVSDKPQAELLAEFLNGRVADIDKNRFVVAASGLGQGEIEAMVLYKTLSADHLLIDDRRARSIAKANDIHCIGALGVLLLARQKNYIDHITPYIQALQGSSLHYSEDLLARVIQLARESLG